MITEHDAHHADEFHISHDGLPCTVWRRQGATHPEVNGGWLVFITTDDGDWHHITGVNAADFHTADNCPVIVLRMGRDRPPAEPVLSLSDRSDDSRDAFGYDCDGYDVDGYDRDGYDEDGYDEDGEDADGHRRGVDAEDLDLAELWEGFPFTSRWRTSERQREFRDHLRTLVSDPDEIDSLGFCGNCDEPAWDDDLNTAGTGESICASCWDNWSGCASCAERFHDDDLYCTLGESEVCEGCRARYYTYCESCDGYYNDNDADDHEHGSGDGCCASPQLAFTIRNDGDEPLANDTRVTVTLPAGTITTEGLKAIRDYLRVQAYESGDVYRELACDLDALGSQWQTRDGNYAKRLSRLAYQAHQLKLPPEILSHVGTIAREHSTAVSTEIDVTRDLNMPAYEFWHESSCWWGSYSASRCALKTNGGFGLRSFDGGGVSGRAWVLPLRKDEAGKLVPTFETMTPDAFVVFNGYGDLRGYGPARILAHMAGWTYRKIAFEAEPMYVNAGGYLIAAEELAEQYTDGSLYLDISQHSLLFETETGKELTYA